MAQTPKKRRKLPKNATQLPDRKFMEKVFGKRIMKKVDALVSELSEDAGRKEISTTSMRER